MTDQIASIGYTLAGIMFLGLTGLLLTRWRGRLHGIWLPLAAIASVGWAIFLARAMSDTRTGLVEVFVAELVFSGAWILMLYQILAGASGTSWLRFLRYSNLILVVAILVIGLGNHYFDLLNGLFAGLGSVMAIGLLLIALTGLDLHL